MWIKSWVGEDGCLQITGAEEKTGSRAFGVSIDRAGMTDAEALLRSAAHIIADDLDTSLRGAIDEDTYRLMLACCDWCADVLAGRIDHDPKQDFDMRRLAAMIRPGPISEV